jgi:hypothetical protein
MQKRHIQNLLHNCIAMRMEDIMSESLDQCTNAELEALVHLETLDQYARRIETLECLLRRVLNDGLTKDVYKRIGEELQHII